MIIELTSAEFDLLWLLAANAGRILSREEIFNSASPAAKAALAALTRSLALDHGPPIH